MENHISKFTFLVVLCQTGQNVYTYLHQSVTPIQCSFSVSVKKRKKISFNLPSSLSVSKVYSKLNYTKFN
jgi:hypothetical protein